MSDVVTPGGASQPHGIPDRRVDEALGRSRWRLARRYRRNAGSAADQVLMRGKAAAALRLEHRVGQDPLLGHIPVRLNLSFWSRTDTAAFRGAALAAEPPGVSRLKPSIFAAVVSASRRRRGSAAMSCFQTSGVRSERDPFVDVLVAALYFFLTSRRAVSAGKLCKEIVEAAILLDNDHDVFDRRSLRAPSHREAYRSEARTSRRHSRRARGASITRSAVEITMLA